MLKLPRTNFLSVVPTPLEPLPRLAREWGARELWIKRDDLTGLAFGGNKTRKLEFLVAEALGRGSKTLLTRGAPQSNHCRQTAAAAARLGLGCVLVLAGEPPGHLQGNLLLDSLLGARLVWTRGRDPDAVLEEEFLKAGPDAFKIPYGGSSAVGAAAYAEAMRELLGQDAGFRNIVFASSSGGTQAGLVAGAKLHGFHGRICGVSVEPPAAVLRERVAVLANEVLGLFGAPQSIEPEQIEVQDAFLGRGYGIVGELEQKAIRSFAASEGVLLDPVYTGRAAGGLRELLRLGGLDPAERTLFWHTGGAPALFAYSESLL